jgi:hypothetical protein
MRENNNKINITFLINEIKCLEILYMVKMKIDFNFSL